MSKSSSYFKKFIIIKSTSRLANALSLDQRALITREIANQSIVRNSIHPLFILAIADAIHQRPINYVDPDSREYALLSSISLYFKENAIKYFNHEFDLIGAQGKLFIASRPKVPRTNKPSDRSERAPSVPIDSVSLNTAIQTYLSLVYPVFLSNMITSLMDALSEHELVNDLKLKQTVLRDYIAFNMSSGLNVTRQSFEEHTVEHKFSRMNLFYALNFNPFSKDEDFTIGQLSHMRHFIYPRSDFKVLLTDLMPIGSVSLGNSSDGGLSKFETRFATSMIRFSLIPSPLETPASFKNDLSDLASGIDTSLSLSTSTSTPDVPVPPTPTPKPPVDTDEEVILDSD